MTTTDATNTRTTRPVVLILALLAAISAFQMAVAMVLPAMTVITTRLEATAADMALSQSLFFAIGGLASVSLPLLDRLGRKRALMLLLVLGVIGSVLIAASDSLALFNIGRWLQAPGVAALPLSFLVLRQSIPAKSFPVSIGWLNALSLGIAGIDGAVAGILTDTIGYQGIFWIIAGAGILAIVLVKLIVVAPPSGVTTPPDFLGMITLGAAMASVTVAISQAGVWGWTDPLTLGLLLGGVALIGVFVLVERASRHPIIEVKHLVSRRVWSMPLVILAGMGAFMSIFALVMPFLAQTPTEVGGFALSPTVYALAAMPGTVLSFALAPLAGALARRIGWKPILTGSLLTSLLGMIGLVLSLGNPIAAFIAFTVFAAVFSGGINTTANALGVLLSPKESPAFLPGLVSVTFSFAASLGIAIGGSMLVVPSAAAFTAALVTAAIMMTLALVFSLLVPRTSGTGEVELKPEPEVNLENRAT